MLPRVRRDSRQLTTFALMENLKTYYAILHINNNTHIVYTYIYVYTYNDKSLEEDLNSSN